MNRPARHTLFAASASLTLLLGCAGAAPRLEPGTRQTQGMSAADADTRAEVVRHDPVAYLRRVQERCAGLEEYTLLFTRYERRGFIPTMHGPEHIRCWFRKEPFSVRMKWLNEDLHYYESVYIEGEHEDKVRFVTRWAVPFLKPPPQVNVVDIQFPVRAGVTKRPVTQFGLERLMDRTLASLDAAAENVVVSYEGLIHLPETDSTVHHVHIEYSSVDHNVPIQDLYIDLATDLPAGTALKLPSGKLDAAYFYEDIDTSVNLTDQDFLLESERESTQTARGAAPEPVAN